MDSQLERVVVRLWNRFASQFPAPDPSGLNVGVCVTDNGPSRTLVSIDAGARTQHIAILGKTGMGKSSLLRYMMRQDLRRRNGFAVFDLHGDLTPFVLRAVAAEELISGRTLTSRLIVIDPSDPEYSAGLKLFAPDREERYRRVADVTAILRKRFQLDAFGARTEELLRNSLLLLAANGLTLLELPLLLTDSAFRAVCLRSEPSSDVRHYFTARYGLLSEAFKAVVREPVLNKVSAFTVDPRFRHLVGQTHGTLDVLKIMDEGKILLINLNRARFGEQAVTLGSLILAMIRNALYSREEKRLFTLYCDELQNLVTFGSEIETLFAEARKFGVAVCAANQYLDQYPSEIRSAVFSAVTHIYFRLSGPDAERVTPHLGPGAGVSEMLKNLPEREVIVKSGSAPFIHARVPVVHTPRVDPSQLYERVRRRWLTPRAIIEREISKRQITVAEGSDTNLEDWN